MAVERNLFPGLPENFDALDAEKLGDLLTEYRAIAKRIFDRDLVEKVVLVSLLLTIFSTIIPTIETRPR